MDALERRAMHGLLECGGAKVGHHPVIPVGGAERPGRQWRRGGCKRKFEFCVREKQNIFFKKVVSFNVNVKTTRPSGKDKNKILETQIARITLPARYAKSAARGRSIYIARTPTRAIAQGATIFDICQKQTNNV
jgi:hypothetical protein